jgi:hypothetical protein
VITYQTEQYRDCCAEIDAHLLNHWHEIALDHTSVPLDKDEAEYQRLADSGQLHITTVRKDGLLIGYHASIVRPHLHYKSTLHAFVDVYYIVPAHRNGRVGIQLFIEAEKALKARGVKKIFSGTKSHKHMGPIFERLGWRETETLYSKVI